MSGLVIELRRMDTALTKVELISHLQIEHTYAFAPVRNSKRLSKDTLIGLHRLIHLGIDR